MLRCGKMGVVTIAPMVRLHGLNHTVGLAFP
jgi:hypothetical protein